MALLSDQLSRYQTRDPIPNENIFFIELGFGKIYNNTDEIGHVLILMVTTYYIL